MAPFVIVCAHKSQGEHDGESNSFPFLEVKMRFLAASTCLIVSIIIVGLAIGARAQDEMVKMCLFYPSASGHARSDPIINQECASDHIHTFYGPLNFHPNTTYEDILNTPPEHSTSPFEENQSLYWHPTIYQVSEAGNGVKTYTRAPELVTSPYYRWDNSAGPETVAFPPEFRMIARSTDDGADMAGESGGNMLVECCDIVEDEDGEEDEDCEEWPEFFFPKRNCDFLGIAFAMPTCWDESKGKGIDNGPLHSSHVAYTEDGTVAGECPTGFDKKIPQVQLFVRVINYRGADFDYVLADGKTEEWHVDFMNGWQEDTLQFIIDTCEVIEDGADTYNPPCNCEDLLTESDNVVEEPVCDVDVRGHIVDEATNNMNTLPRGTCEGPDLIAKTWDVIPPFDCEVTPMAPITPRPSPAPAPATPEPTPQPANPEEEEEEEEEAPEEEEPEEQEEQEEEEAGEEVDCLEECCFSDVSACNAMVEFLCGDDTFIPNCELDCEFMVEEGLIDEDELEDCFENCPDFQGNCYDQNEALCEPCELDCEEECCFASLEACEEVVGFICEEEEEEEDACIEEHEDLMCGPCDEELEV